MYEQDVNVRQVLKWRSPELRVAEERGFAWGVFVGVVLTGIAFATICALV